MQRNLSLISHPSFPSAYLSLLLDSFSLPPLPPLLLPNFLICLPFLSLAYVGLILSHYDDLRFSFSCWPIKTKQQQQSCLSSYCRQTASLIRWPLLCILYYNLKYQNGLCFFLYPIVTRWLFLMQQRWCHTQTG